MIQEFRNGNGLNTENLMADSFSFFFFFFFFAKSAIFVHYVSLLLQSESVSNRKGLKNVFVLCLKM